MKTLNLRERMTRLSNTPRAGIYLRIALLKHDLKNVVAYEDNDNRNNYKISHNKFIHHISVGDTFAATAADLEAGLAECD